MQPQQKRKTLVAFRLNEDSMKILAQYQRIYHLKTRTETLERILLEFKEFKGASTIKKLKRLLDPSAKLEGFVHA